MQTTTTSCAIDLLKMLDALHFQRVCITLCQPSLHAVSSRLHETLWTTFYLNMPTEKVPLKAALALMATGVPKKVVTKASVNKATASPACGGRKAAALDARSASQLSRDSPNLLASPLKQAKSVSARGTAIAPSTPRALLCLSSTLHCQSTLGL